MALVPLVALSVGTVAAFAQGSAPRRVTLNMVNPGDTFRANRFIQSHLRFSRDVVTIRSGGTLVVTNRTPGEPHSLSFVPKRRVPKTIRAVERCGAPKTICGDLGVAHQIDQQGNAGKAVVDVGQPGIDTASSAGDSYIFAPKGQQGSRMRLTVSARPGTTLYFICGFHAWMQGRLQVR